jgi:MoaA/NifB/PqqE/SkfB family radical SAM enzyme
MKIPHTGFCVLPWISLEASPIGTVRPCCLALDEIQDSTGKKFDLTTADLSSIQNSDHMRDLRRQFLDHQRPSTCQRCWNEEDAGRKSKRLHTLDRLKHMVSDEVWLEDAKPLMFLDLKLGNICNLKCRICGSWSSSTFAAEELAEIPERDQRRESFHYTMLRQGAWPRNSPAFWQQLSSVMQQIRYIEFTGGEPFMISEHFDLLQRLVEQGVAADIEIHYNTNGTQYPEKAPDIWRHFRHVEIAFSIDDVGERFEYQRSGAVWAEVNTNIQRFRELRHQQPNISLQVCCTVNIFNVLYLAEVAEWIDQQEFDFVYWNMLHDAPEWSIRNLQWAAKRFVQNHLRWAQFQPRHRSEIDRIVEFMISGGLEWERGTVAKIRELDRRRNQRLDMVAPLLAYVIKYDSPTK